MSVSMPETEADLVVVLGRLLDERITAAVRPWSEKIVELDERVGQLEAVGQECSDGVTNQTHKHT